MSPFVFDIVARASCVMAAGGAAAALCRRRSAAARHLVWTLTVIALLALPVLLVALPRWRIAVPVAAPRPDQPAHAIDIVVRKSAAETPAAGMATLAGGAAAEPSAGPDVSWAWLAALPAVYAGGVLLFLLRLLFERWAVSRLARGAADVIDPEWNRLLSECAASVGVQTRVRLLRSVARSMPMAFGTRVPSILIPAVADMWPDDRRRAVLLHELAHIARRDCLTQLLAAVTCAVYWVHPGVWWIARRLRVERELACDDRVLETGANAREYAEHLLELAFSLGGSRSPALAVSMARPRQVEGRMLAALDRARNRTPPAFGSRLAGVGAAAALLVPLATVQAMAVPAEQEKRPAAAVAETTATAETLSGTWEIRATQTAPAVYLRLSESAGSSHASTAPIDSLHGFAPSQLSGPGGAAAFSIRRDGGTLAFEGTFRSGAGAGTYTFTPSASFPNELVKRGFPRPTAADQYVLARADIGFAFLDELTMQKYARPDPHQLVNAAQHGVELGYLREMGGLGYRFAQIDALIGLREHGVSPQYIRELGAQGLTRLTADDLVRARDHGVSPEYVRDLAALGYPRMSLDELIAARDHGVSPEYVRELQGLGYRLTLDELTTARDHGISADYVRQLNAQGREGLSLGELVTLRQQGPGYRQTRLMSIVHYHVQAAHRWFKEFADHWMN